MAASARAQQRGDLELLRVINDPLSKLVRDTIDGFVSKPHFADPNWSSSSDAVSNVYAMPSRMGGASGTLTVLTGMQPPDELERDDEEDQEDDDLVES